MILSFFKTVAEFYPFSVHLIYAVIIAISFGEAARVIIPINSIWSSYDNIERAFALLVAYFIIISGWVGYSKSISKRPHSDNRLGTTRFVVDLFILFLVFYLISLTDPSKFPKFSMIFPTFLWTITIMFVAYLVWDGLKYFEYRYTKEEERISVSRGRKTLYYFILILAVSIVYSTVLPPYNTLKWNGIVIWDFIFIVFALAIVFSYRKSKWIVPRVKARKRRSGLDKPKSSDG
jgi:hypothetical protein